MSSSLPYTVPLVAEPISLCLHTCSNSVGQLTFVRGWNLKSQDSNFGSLSGLIARNALKRAGSRGGLTRFLAISDRGDWFEFGLPEDGGTENVMQLAGMGPIRDLTGGSVYGEMADAEAVTMAPDDKTLYVSFERSMRIWRYANGAGSDASDLGVSWAISNACSSGGNLGVEALEVLNTTHMVGICESAPNRVLPILLFSLGNGRGPLRAGQVYQLGEYVPSRFDLTVSSLARLPGGKSRLSGVLVLERVYIPLVGVTVRICHLSQAELDRGGHMRPTVLAELTPAIHRTDNFQGMSVFRDPLQPDHLRIYILADDNMDHGTQQTLLYEFVMSDVVSASSPASSTASPSPQQAQSAEQPASAPQQSSSTGAPTNAQPPSQTFECKQAACTPAVLARDAGGYTCGARMDWLVSQGVQRAAACQRVASLEFPGICGECDPTTASVTAQATQAAPKANAPQSWTSPDPSGRQGSCQSPNGGQGAYREVWGLSDEADCRARCAGLRECKAYEFSWIHGYNRCEIHTMAVDAVYPVHGHVCYQKS